MRRRVSRAAWSGGVLVCLLVLPGCLNAWKTPGASARDASLRTRFNRSHFAVMRGEYDFAARQLIALYQEMTPEDDIADDVTFWLAHCYQQLGHTRKAADTYREVIANFPGGVYARNAREALAEMERAPPNAPPDSRR